MSTPSGALTGILGRAFWGNKLWWEVHITRRLTFCCLHSLQAFLLPPLRFPVIGGMVSISQGSEALEEISKPAPGRVILGLFRMSQLRAWGVKRVPWFDRPGVMAPRNSSSIRFEQLTPEEKWNGIIVKAWATVEVVKS